MKEKKNSESINGLVEMRRTEVKKEVKDTYDKKREKVDDSPPHPFFFPWVILGSPGLDLSYLTGNILDDTKKPKRSSVTSSSSNATDNESHKKTDLIKELLLNQSKNLKFKENFLEEGRKRDEEGRKRERKAIIDSLITDLCNSPNAEEHTEELTKLKRERRELLREGAFTYANVENGSNGFCTPSTMTSSSSSL